MTQPRAGHRQARRGRQAARPGSGHRGGLPVPRDHRVDRPPRAQPVRRDEGERREAPERARGGEHRLKRIIADQALDIDMVKELNDCRTRRCESARSTLSSRSVRRSWAVARDGRGIAPVTEDSERERQRINQGELRSGRRDSNPRPQRPESCRRGYRC